MLHAIETVVEALDQAAAGSTSREIGVALDVPYEMVRAWRSGRVPRAAAHVLSGGLLCAGCGCPAHPVLDRERYAYLLGLYLGDGCLARNGKNSYLLRITMDTTYPAILEEARQAVMVISPNGRGDVAYERRSNCANVYASGRFWPCLFPQHGPGKKHNRPIVLEEWQKDIVTDHAGSFVRGLIQSDGWRGLNKVTVKGRDYAYPRYQFSNRSDDIRRLFCDACDRLGVAWRPWGRWHISVARRADVALLDEFVGPKA